MRTETGRAQWSWLLGEGEARGIALVFLVSGILTVVIAALAFLAPSYRRISASYAGQTEQIEAVPPGDGEAAGGDAEFGAGDRMDAESRASPRP